MSDAHFVVHRMIRQHEYSMQSTTRLTPLTRPCRRAPLAEILLSLLVTACETTRRVDEPLRTVDSAGVRLTTIAVDTASLPHWRLGEEPELVLTGAESGDSAALSLTGPVRWLSDGALVVADLGASRLLLFDASGRFQRALGRRGAGPGELRNVRSLFVLPGDTLTTYDGALRRLTVWHPSGGYVRQVSLQDEGALDAMPADAWIWRDSAIVSLQLAVTPRPPIPTGVTVQRWPMRASLFLRDGTGRVLQRAPDFDGMYMGIYATGDTRLPFSHQQVVAHSRDRVYFGSGADFRLEYLGADFAKSGELRWPNLDEPLTSAEVQRVRAETRDLLASRMPRERADEALALNFLPEILPAKRPSMGRVFVDDADRLWVERFEALRLGMLAQTPGAVWHVLEPDGRPVARLTLPENVRLESVREGRAAVVQRDSLDVETVALYPLLTPR